MIILVVLKYQSKNMSMRNNFSRTHSSARIDAGVGIGPGGVNARYKGGISAFWKISDCIVAGITILELVQAMARKKSKEDKINNEKQKSELKKDEARENSKIRKDEAEQ